MKHFFPVILFIFAASNFASAADFVPLFNGQDLTGWKSLGGKNKVSVENGQLILETGDTEQQSYIVTEREYENFIAKVEFKFDAPFNSGFQFRAVPHEGKDVSWGYQADISPEKNNGGLYDEGVKHRWIQNITDPKYLENTQKSFKKDDWNTLEVQAIGPSLKTWVNGTLIADLIDVVYEKGFVGFQIHASAMPGKLRIRSAVIEELPATPWTPFFKDKQFIDHDVMPVGKWEWMDATTVHATTPVKDAKDGMIVSKRAYENFLVKVSFIQLAGDSGLYFRSIKIPDNHWLRGYQCDISFGNSAGLWETAGGGLPGRGWLRTPEKEMYKKTYIQKDWNAVAAFAVHDRIATFLNGEQVADMIDPKCNWIGVTGLQMHGGANNDYTFKDYEIKVFSNELVKLMERE